MQEKNLLTHLKNILIEDVSNEVSTFKFWLCCIALIVLFVGSILLHIELNY
jgi:hypothetical protein